MKKIAVLTGGDSSEREIALQSSKFIIENLEKNFKVSLFDFPFEIEKFLKSYKDFDAAVPVFHGPGGEDGTVQGFLEILKVPYLFSKVEAHAIGMNKFMTKRLARKCGLKTPEYKLISHPERHTVYAPAVLKLNHGGSSIGVKIVRQQEEIDQVLNEFFALEKYVLVEKPIVGREFTVAVIQEYGKDKALPVIEIISKNEFFDFESKYDPNLADEICPAQIDDTLEKSLQLKALKIHEALGARHLSRSDFMVDDEGQIWFLEINTIPGLTRNSLTPKTIRASGRDPAVLLEGWVNQVSS
ncbi:D-alanine--D-alanine ligase [Patescibacteria group bacterium]